MSIPPDRAVSRAASLIRQADALLVTAGAGMGVDSGLPDFRGDRGFWHAYPALRKAGLRFTEIANPAAFRANPRRAWGFYGHRLDLYRRTAPHAGYGILLTWTAAMPHGGFVFTSNVDGQFQHAGLAAERTVECHGSIHWLQCLAPCSQDLWPAEPDPVEIDEIHCRMRSPLPCCPRCGSVARPNILMFGDWEWIAERTETQQRRLATWLADLRRPVVIELGAGTAVPTVRRFSESLGLPLVRINPDAGADTRTASVVLGCGALAALRKLDAAVVGLT